MKAFVGTPLYIAPEIIKDESYSYKADIWAMGIIFYELMALKPPFNAINFETLILKVCNSKIKPLP